jgi:hypothetical protein
MDKGTKFDSGYTRSTMEAMGFATCKEGYRGFVRFLFLGNEYEIVRYRNCACLGMVLDVTSDPEFETYLAAGEELMEANPDMQCLFSTEGCEFRLRIWGSCTTIEEFSGFVRDALGRLDKVQDSLQARVLRQVYTTVGPKFENILSSGGRR